MTAPPFWRRYAAYSLDWLLLALPVSLLSMPLARTIAQSFQTMVAAMQTAIDRTFEQSAGAPDLLQLPTTLLADHDFVRIMTDNTAMIITNMLGILGICCALAAVYFIALESSTLRASLGKHLLGIQIGRADDLWQPPGFSRSIARFFAGSLSWLTLNIGHAMAGWRRDGRAMHDLISGTRLFVRDNASPQTPLWARAWLWLQALALLAGIGWLVWRWIQVGIIAAGL